MLTVVFYTLNGIHDKPFRCLSLYAINKECSLIGHRGYITVDFTYKGCVADWIRKSWGEANAARTGSRREAPGSITVLNSNVANYARDLVTPTQPHTPATPSKSYHYDNSAYNLVTLLRHNIRVRSRGTIIISARFIISDYARTTSNRECVGSIFEAGRTVQPKGSLSTSLLSPVYGPVGRPGDCRWCWMRSVMYNSYKHIGVSR